MRFKSKVYDLQKIIKQNKKLVQLRSFEKVMSHIVNGEESENRDPSGSKRAPKLHQASDAQTWSRIKWMTS